MEDQLLWENLKQGSREALKSIYDQHIESLLQYGCRFSDDRKVVEDCLHDLFLGIWKNRDGLSATDSIQRYLMVALRRAIFKRLKTQFALTTEEKIPFVTDLSAEDQWIANEEYHVLGKSLQDAFSQLSSRQKEAIYLKYYQNLPYETICEIMGLTYQSVRNLVFSGIQSLRKVMVAVILSIFLIQV